MHIHPPRYRLPLPPFPCTQSLPSQPPPRLELPGALDIMDPSVDVLFNVAENRNVCHRRDRDTLEDGLSTKFELTTTVPEGQVAALVCEGQENDEGFKHVLATGRILTRLEKTSLRLGRSLSNHLQDKRNNGVRTIGVELV